MVPGKKRQTETPYNGNGKMMSLAFFIGPAICVAIFMAIFNLRSFPSLGKPTLLSRCGTNASKSISSSPSQDVSEVLSELYRSTNNGGDLIGFAQRQLSRISPALSKRSRVKIGTPSLARDGSTGRVVLGFRIEVPTTVNADGGSLFKRGNTNFLLLCELTSPIESVECQDSGLFPWVIPPQCNPANWLNPSKKTFWGFLTTGPEDARLFFDSEGALHATFGGRGCHANTPYNQTNPINSLYEIKWDKEAGGVWTPNGVPNLLEVRTRDGKSLDDAYPPVTKSWIPVPSVIASNGSMPVNEKKINHLLLGFTKDMTSSVVYEIYDTADSVYFVRPTKNSMDLKDADIRSFRGSTNLVPFHGFLLGIGHPKRSSKYFLYWYAICPQSPYMPIARSNLFNIRDEEYYSKLNRSDVKVSFALGLALEGDDLYISWSEKDRNPLLSVYNSSFVFDMLVNSSSPPSHLRETKEVSKLCPVE